MSSSDVIPEAVQPPPEGAERFVFCWLVGRPRLLSVLSSGLLHGLLGLMFLCLTFETFRGRPERAIVALAAPVSDRILEDRLTVVEQPELETPASGLLNGGQWQAVAASLKLDQDVRPLLVDAGEPSISGPTLQETLAAEIAQKTPLSASGPAQAVSSGTGTGAGLGSGADSGSGFFGLTPAGRRVVYVLDCSRSMNHPHGSAAKTRFKRMKVELVKSVAALPPESQFFFTFFNSQPIPMPSLTAVPATPGAVQQYLSWMQPLQADGDTEPTEAIRLALRLQPDVLYFLTDGSFIYRVQQELLHLQTGRTRLHTLAFETPLTDGQKEAKRLLAEGRDREARDMVATNRELRVAREAYRAELFLQNLAAAHGGRFILIPHVESAASIAAPAE